MDFPIIWSTMSIFSLNIVFLLVEIFHPFFVIFVGGVCLSIYYTRFLFVYFGCAGSVGNFFGGPGHIFSVWDSAVWSAGPVQFI